MAPRKREEDCPRWWTQRPKGFRRQLRDALASGDPGRIGIAWAIVKETGGARHGALKDAAEKFGVDYKLMTSQLNGSKNVTPEMLSKISEATGTKLSVLWSGAHPFAVPKVESRGYCEPGDQNWETVYSALRVMEPEIPSEAELRSKYPQLFRNL